MDELKPCPFCGGKAKIINYIDSRFFPTVNKAYVKCIKCHSSGDVFKQKNNSIDYIEEAIEAWNRRVEDGEK